MVPIQIVVSYLLYESYIVILAVKLNHSDQWNERVIDMQSLIFFEKLQISLDLCTYCLCDSKKRVANGKLFMYLKKPNKRLYKTANSKHLRSSDLLWLVSTLIVCNRCPLYRHTVPVWWRRLYLSQSALWLCCSLRGQFRWIQLW